MRKKIITVAIFAAFVGVLSYFSASYLWRLRFRQEAWILWRLSEAIVLVAVVVFLYGLNAKTSKKGTN